MLASTMRSVKSVHIRSQSNDVLAQAVLQLSTRDFYDAIYYNDSSKLYINDPSKFFIANLITIPFIGTELTITSTFTVLKPVRLEGNRHFVDFFREQFNDTGLTTIMSLLIMTIKRRWYPIACSSNALSENGKIAEHFIN